MASNQILVVGAGFAGATCAEQLARHGERVVIIDKRDHIGGNAYDAYDSHGLLIHPYGPHIFHTNSKGVFKYLSQFTSWRFYEHEVRARVNDQLYPVPINRLTLNWLYGMNMNTDEDAKKYLESVSLDREIKTSEDVVLRAVGEDLTNKFFRGYTKKQWGMDLSALSPSVVSRIPTRFNEDCRYFTDDYQFMPADGYTSMFANMLDHPSIDLKLQTSAHDMMFKENWKFIIWTGPIDEYFEYSMGMLPYRSLKFKHYHTMDKQMIQSIGTVNYPDENVPYTRITEFKHLTGQDSIGTSWCEEYPSKDGDPFYPIPTSENAERYKSYEKLAEQCHGKVMFVGRLAQYKYYNMDQVVAAALSSIHKIL